MSLEEEYSVRSGQNLAAVHPQKDDLGTLIGRAARGDESALASLYDSTAALVNGLALRILRDRGAAEEVTGDVYLQVWRQAVRYDESRGSALSWLLTLARTRAIDRLRSGANQRARTEPLRAAFAIPSTAPDPEEHSHLSQRRRIVQQVLAQLPAEQRRAIELGYFGGLSHSEIAASLGEPLGTVKTRIRLGMLRLREGLAAAGKDAF